MSVEKCEDLQVGQVMMVGEDVSHFIGEALDVGDFMVVLVVLAVEAGETAKVGSRLIQSDGTLPISGDGGAVVIQSQKGQLPEIIEGGCHVCLGKDASLLQVTVCKVSQRVVE